MPFQLGQTVVFLFHGGIHLGDLLLDCGIVALGHGQFLQREVVFIAIGDDHEIGVALHLGDLAQGILFLPFGLDCLGFVEV